MDDRRLEDGSPLGPRSAVAELGSRQPPPEAGQARTTVPRLLEVTRRWKVPVARYAHERERRLRKEGARAYVQPSGDKLPDYSIDPHTDPAPREPIEREIESIFSISFDLFTW